jgi:uncharacterized protein (TIGR02453 family)
MLNDHVDMKPVLSFLSGIQKNNNKPWFEEHRPAYEKARGQFEELIDELIMGFGSVENLGGITAKDCVMRIYRDIRFSKDKSPYKRSMAASIGPGGKRSVRLAYYLHLEPPDASIIAGGLHAPDPAQLTKFREAIDRDPKKFKKVVSNKAFVQTFGAVEGERLKTVPKGYDRDHPEIDLLRMKEVVAIRHLTDAEVLSPKFSATVIEAFTVMKPFLDHLNSVIA